MAGVDVINGIGELETSQLLVLKQLLVDKEIALRCQRLAEGIDCSEQKKLFEEIKEVGPGGHFLSADSTFRLCRSNEFYQPLLSCPTLNALPDQTAAIIGDLLARATKELN
jgi:trimethylamine:corrinoid methyltransferase-like protein